MQEYLNPTSVDSSCAANSVRPEIIGAPKTTKTQGSHLLVPRPSIGGIPQIMACRILMFMWSFGALNQGVKEMPRQGSTLNQQLYALHIEGGQRQVPSKPQALLFVESSKSSYTVPKQEGSWRTTGNTSCWPRRKSSSMFLPLYR